MRTNPFPFVQKEPDLVPDGAYPARLATVRQFGNAFGLRIGLDFELLDGELAGTVLTASAAPSASPKGKLADILRGLLGREPTEAELLEPVRLTGSRCRVLVRTEANRSGKAYSNVAAVFR